MNVKEQDRPALIVITGIMASGKSTVARLLAQRFERGVHIEAEVSGLIPPSRHRKKLSSIFFSYFDLNIKSD